MRYNQLKNLPNTSKVDGGQLESLCYFGHRARFEYHNLKLLNVFIMYLYNIYIINLHNLNVFIPNIHYEY